MRFACLLCFLATVEGKRRTSGYEEFILEKNVTLAPWQYFNTNISQTTKLSLNLTTSGRGNRGEVHYSVWRKNKSINPQNGYLAGLRQSSRLHRQICQGGKFFNIIVR